MPSGLVPTVSVAAALKVPSPLPRRMLTVPGAFEAPLPAVLSTARSGLPSPLKSPTAMPCGLAPTEVLTGAAKPPLPLPSRIETLLPFWFAVARSILPSPLKSAATTA